MLQDKYGPAREWKPESKMRPRAKGNNWAAVVEGEWYEGRASSYDNMVEQVSEVVVGEVGPGRLCGILFGGNRQPIQSAYSWPGRPSYGCENIDARDLWQAVAGYIDDNLIDG
jgi:hypothetical protein